MPDELELKHVPAIVMFVIAVALVLVSFMFSGFGNWNEKNLYRYSTAFLLVACILPYVIRISHIGVDGIMSFSRKYLRPYHTHLGTLGFIIAILHGLFEGRCNHYIATSMTIFSFLLVTGLALYVKKLPPENKRRAYLLHSHYLFVFFMLLLVVLGHLIEEF